MSSPLRFCIVTKKVFPKLLLLQLESAKDQLNKSLLIPSFKISSDEVIVMNID